MDNLLNEKNYRASFSCTGVCTYLKWLVLYSFDCIDIRVKLPDIYFVTHVTLRIKQSSKKLGALI